MNGDNDSTISSKQAGKDHTLGPVPSFNFNWSQALTNAESILSEATTAAGNTVMTAEKATSEGSKFEVLDDLTETSKYGQLVSNVDGSVISKDAALHEGKIYAGVTKSTWTVALMCEEFGRLFTPKEVATASEVALLLMAQRIADAEYLCNSDPTMERWKVLRQNRQWVEALCDQKLTADVKQYLLKDHDGGSTNLDI